MYQKIVKFDRTRKALHRALTLQIEEPISILDLIDDPKRAIGTSNTMETNIAHHQHML